MSNKDTGFLGENMAANHLINLGYEIIERNWRYKHLELDIIASKDGVLNIIEVKTRTNIQFGFPEQSIGRQKMQYLKNAAAVFQYKNPKWKRIQFGVIAIHLNEKSEWEILFLEDFFL